MVFRSRRTPPCGSANDPLPQGAWKVLSLTLRQSDLDHQGDKLASSLLFPILDLKNWVVMYFIQHIDEENEDLWAYYATFNTFLILIFRETVLRKSEK